MANVNKFILSFMIPLFLISGVAWFVKDEKVVHTTEVINRVPDTQYCYTSEDDDWLICRLR